MVSTFRNPACIAALAVSPAAVPVSIKAVDLSPEYQLLFGKAFNNHKSAYEVRFERKDPDDKDILPDDARTIGLFLSGAEHYTSAAWSLLPDEEEV